MYLLKYIYDKDEEFFKKFITMYNGFSLRDKIQVMCNVKANLIGQGKVDSQRITNKMVDDSDMILIKKLGIPYEIFASLDYDKQQILIELHKKF